MKSKTLYKLSKLGKVLEWTIEWNDVSYWTVTGEKDGAKVTSSPTFVEQKNVGKSNETSLSEQVENEVSSKIQHQMDGGYTEDLPTGERRFEVSLAEKYQDRVNKGRADYPYIVQPKLDGIRCYIKYDQEQGVKRAYSRNHKPFYTVCFANASIMSAIFAKYPDIILDGELYDHELKDNFNKIVSLVRKTKPTHDDIYELQELIRYNCFDCYIPSQPELSYIERNSKLLEIVQSLPDDKLDGDCFRLVMSCGIVGNTVKEWRDLKEYSAVMADNHEDVEKYIQKYTDEKFEGVMLKKDTAYFFGRDKNLLKFKRFIDREFVILDIEDGKGNKAGIGANVVCSVNGNRFKAGINGTVEYAKELFKNKDKYIGKLCTVKYQELTPEKEDGTGGVPRFGKMVAIRDYES